MYINNNTFQIEYIKKEQINTKYNLNKKIINTPPNKNDDILVEFDATKLNQNNFQLLQQLPSIIQESGEVGEFELDIFKIIINNINPQNLIYNGTQRTN